MLLFVFFFFQAEDGIRDKLVTGVQTCALPILPPNATVTFPVKVGTRFSAASRAVTRNDGASAVPAVAVVGSTVNSSCVAGPGATSNAALVGATSAPPDALAVSV